ncbi:MAG TPA: hypothetical protein V6C52_02935 [Coleofasciculaceae cyanobacterium]
MPKTAKRPKSGVSSLVLKIQEYREKFGFVSTITASHRHAFLNPEGPLHRAFWRIRENAENTAGLMMLLDALREHAMHESRDFEGAKDPEYVQAMAYLEAVLAGLIEELEADDDNADSLTTDVLTRGTPVGTLIGDLLAPIRKIDVVSEIPQFDGYSIFLKARAEESYLTEFKLAQIHGFGEMRSYQQEGWKHTCRELLSSEILSLPGYTEPVVTGFNANGQLVLQYNVPDPSEAMYEHGLLDLFDFWSTEDSLESEAEDDSDDEDDSEEEEDDETDTLDDSEDED